MTNAISAVDEGYANPRLAEMYDAENPWHPQDDFYQALDLAGGSVLDVGCGTGRRLISTRARGHTGHLTGVEPGLGMLGVARAASDQVEWIHGDAQSVDVGRRSELLTMTGHAFQTLLDDDAVRESLANFHRHLVPGGLLAFETRNPSARSWEGWTRDASFQVVANPAGEQYESWVEGARADGDLVNFRAPMQNVVTGEVLVSTSTLRFIDPEHLRTLLEEAGFTIEGWYGDWDRGPVTPSALEVVVLARACAIMPP